MNTEIILKNKTMTSLQIAEVTGRRHSNVLRDINNMLQQLDCQAKLNFELSKYEDTTGRKLPKYNLTYKGVLCLASGYDANLRMKIINRWEELENEKRSNGFEIPQTFSQALQLAADQAKQIEEQQRQIEEQQKTIEIQAPLVNLGDAVMQYDNDISIAEMAKILNQNGFDTGDRRFRATLKRDGLMTRDGLPSQKARNMDVLSIIKEKYETKYGTTGVYTKTVVTPKGQEYFVNRYIYQYEHTAITV